MTHKMRLKITFIASILLFAKGFIPHRIHRHTTKLSDTTLSDTTLSESEYIPKPPTAEAIIRLQKEGYSYLRCLSALVIEKNNETSALIYLETTPNVKDYVKDKI
tara:strand:+ start:74 stop:388 length:315 start_codon:yes stop_codon:yes gene_type:complete